MVATSATPTYKLHTEFFSKHKVSEDCNTPFFTRDILPIVVSRPKVNNVTIALFDARTKKDEQNVIGERMSDKGKSTRHVEGQSKVANYLLVRCTVSFWSIGCIFLRERIRFGNTSCLRRRQLWSSCIQIRSRVIADT